MSELKSIAIDKLLERHSYCAEKAIDSIEVMIEERLATIEDLNNEIENLRVDKDRLSIIYNYSQVLSESIEPMADHLIKEVVKDNVYQPVDYYAAMDRFNNFIKGDDWAEEPANDRNLENGDYPDEETCKDLAKASRVNYLDLGKGWWNGSEVDVVSKGSCNLVPLSSKFKEVSYYEAFKASLGPHRVFMKNLFNVNISMALDKAEGYEDDHYISILKSDQLVDLTSVFTYEDLTECEDLKVLYNKAPSIIELYIETDQDSSEPVNEPDEIDEKLDETDQSLPDPDEDMEDFAELDHNVVVYTDQDLIKAAKGAAETWGWGCDLLEDPTKISKFSPFSLACFHTILMDDLQANVDRDELEEFITDSPYFEEYPPGMWKLSQDCPMYSYFEVIKAAEEAIKNSKINPLKLTDAEAKVFGLWAFIMVVCDGVTSVELSDVKEAKQVLADHPRITMVTETHYRLEEEDGV